MKFEANILKANVRLLKIILLPIIGFLIFTLYVFMSGYQGKSKPAKIPALIEIDTPFWVGVLLIFVFLILILSAYKLLTISVISHSDTISINDSKIVVENDFYYLNFKIRNIEKLKFKVSIIQTKIFNDKFYRIGKIKLKYSGDRFIFYFPITDYEKECNLVDYFKRIER